MPDISRTTNIPGLKVSPNDLTQLIPYLTSVAKAMLRGKDRDVIEDWVQDGLVSCITRLDTFDPVRGTLKTWAGAVIRNLIRDGRPRRNEAESLTSAEDMSELDVIDERGVYDEDDDTAHTKLHDRLALLLNKLTIEEAQIIDDYYLKGMTDQEISAKRGIPRYTVNKHRLIAIARLKELLRK